LSTDQTEHGNEMTAFKSM